MNTQVGPIRAECRMVWEASPLLTFPIISHPPPPGEGCHLQLLVSWQPPCDNEGDQGEGEARKWRRGDQRTVAVRLNWSLLRQPAAGLAPLGDSKCSLCSSSFVLYFPPFATYSLKRFPRDRPQVPLLPFSFFPPDRFYSAPHHFAFLS